MNDDDQILWFGQRAIIIWGLSILALVVSASGIWYFTLAPRNDVETKGTEHSYTYVETKREQLIKLQQEWTRLDTQQLLHKDEPDVVLSLDAQKKSTILRMRSEVALIPNGSVPDDVKRFLDTH